MNKTLKELLDTDFELNEEGKLIGYFTLKRINEIENVIEILYKENKQLKKELKREKEFSKDSYHKFEDMIYRIDKAIEKIQLIIDYGFDYDGFNRVESLKGLIDMLVDFARQSKNILKGEENNE